MTPERWAHVKEVFGAALETAQAERSQFLESACSGDAELRAEVEGLLAGNEERSWQSPAALLVTAAAELPPGDTIAHYRILSKLGEGGMGAVYRAADTKLNREVAIKVLPPEFAHDSGRMQRFKREAQVLASLNHPNIAAIYGVEQGAIVMELVEGATLAGPLPAATAINYARQIAAGLEAAHEKGIVHRDLKPANIKVTAEGVVKLLDFGLAKSQGESTASDPAASPTMSLALTQAGMILGTAAYMSPEQARGKPVDRRSDIWAFGVILFELLTGKHPYGTGGTVTDVLAAIVLKEPDLAALPNDTPPGLGRLIEHCLRKDPKQRLRDIADAHLLLDNAPPASRSRTWLPWMVAAALAIVGFIAGLAWKRPASAGLSPATVRVSIPLPPATGWPVSNAATQWVPSPDGRNLALIVAESGKNTLWMRPLGAAAAYRLDKTDDANYPFWSPDSQAVAFFAEGSLRRIPAAGGPSVKICDIAGGGSASGTGDGGAWNSEGVIVFAAGTNPLLRVSATGGIPAPASELAKGEVGHYWPQFLPGGRHFLYESRGGSEAGIYVQELGSPKRVLVLKTTMRAMWTPPGLLLFTREQYLFAQRMNAATYQLEGEPVLVASDVKVNIANGRSTFAVSSNGILLYRPGAQDSVNKIKWLDRTGKTLSTAGSNASITYLVLSPDEKSAALMQPSGSNFDVWVMDLASGVTAPMTRGGRTGTNPVWSPDSKRLLIKPTTGGLETITVASGQAIPLTSDDSLLPFDWSPDGNFILCADEARRHLYLLPLKPGSEPEPVAASQFTTSGYSFSPDGKYVAYVSNETGGSEVFVAAFPSFSVRRRVSQGAGSNAVWGKSGKQLYYLSMSTGRLTEVEIRTGADIQIGQAKALFVHGTHFGVAADGRFLIREPISETPSVPELSLVFNWPASIKLPD